jgi:hypothetical protein
MYGLFTGGAYRVGMRTLVLAAGWLALLVLLLPVRV